MARPRKVTTSPFENPAGMAPSVSPAPVAPVAPISALSAAAFTAAPITGPVHDGSEYSTEAAPVSRIRAFAGPEEESPAEDVRTTNHLVDAVAPADGTRRRRWGERAARLSDRQRPGFKRYWAIDLNDRIDQMRQRGYTVVTNKDTGKPVTASAGSHPSGGRLVQVLMEIPQAFADEDFMDKQESLNATDNQIYTGRHNQDVDDRQYVPRNGMNVRVETGRGR